MRFSLWWVNTEWCSKISHACTVKKGYRFSRPQPGCYWPNSPWPRIFYFFQARERLPCESRLGTEKRYLFYSVCTVKRSVRTVNKAGFYSGSCILPWLYAQLERHLWALAPLPPPPHYSEWKKKQKQKISWHCPFKKSSNTVLNQPRIRFPFGWDAAEWDSVYDESTLSDVPKYFMLMHLQMVCENCKQDRLLFCQLYTPMAVCPIREAPLSPSPPHPPPPIIPSSWALWLAN